MIHKRTARRKSLQHEGLLHSASHQTKLWIETALKKANTAVKHDTVNDFEEAVFYYSEAVDLLNKVLENSKEAKEDKDGLKDICDIYLERIDFLTYLTQTDLGVAIETKEKTSSCKEDFEGKNQSTQSSGKHSPDTNSSSIQNSSVNTHTQDSSRSPKQEYFNSVFLNMFAKKKTKKKESIYHFFSLSKPEQPKPKASKSTPTEAPESLWKRQAKSKSHHLSSDNIPSSPSRRSSITSPHVGSTDALCLHFGENKNGREKSRNCLPLHSKSYEKRETQINEDRFSPILPRRNCNRNSPSSGIYCTSSIFGESTEDYNGSFKKTGSNPCLKIPKKSSQRRRNSSESMPFARQISEPIRESSLNHNHNHGRRTRNLKSPSISSEFEFSNTDIPNGLERKVESIASHSLNHPTSASLPVRKSTTAPKLNTVPVCLDLSNVAINSNNSNIPPSSPSTIKIPIPGTVKIDPRIIMSYPEAISFSNESLTNLNRPSSPLKNGYITDRIYVSKGFL